MASIFSSVDSLTPLFSEDFNIVLNSASLRKKLPSNVTFGQAAIS